MIEPRSNTINRNKLSALTGGDYETIKFLEGTQVDAAAAIGGANDALEAAQAAQVAADAAQVAADQAAADAALALSAAAAAQAAAVAAQTSANTAITNAATAQAAAVAAQTTANSALTLATTINGDYVSKTLATAQSIASTFQAASYRVGGNQVVGARVTGWTASTGTTLLGAFNANTAYAAGAAYLQSEAAAVAAGLTEARQRIIALETAMRTHGLIN